MLTCLKYIFVINQPVELQKCNSAGDNHPFHHTQTCIKVDTWTAFFYYPDKIVFRFYETSVPLIAGRDQKTKRYNNAWHTNA